MAKKRHIAILDTTLRDGEQTQGVSFSPAEKLNLAKALLKQLRVDRIEVASARVSEGEKEAVAQIISWAKTVDMAERVEVLGFVDFKRSVDWIREAGGQVINLLSKGSEKHCRQQLQKTLVQHVGDIRKTVNYALKQGLSVNLYLEDWSNGYLNSPEYVYEMMERLQDAGIDHFMLPDTLGVLTPDEVFESLSDMTRRFPDCRFDFHPHNDYGLGTANAMAAVKAGVTSIHCTVNCLGERAGNASLAEVAVNLKDRMAVKLSINESHLERLSSMVENFSGKRIADNAPIIGADVFTQTSGIHADGDKKGGLYQTRLSPERFARRRNYALGKMSGKASLQKNLDKLDISLSDENLAKVLQRVVALGDSKKTITADDLPFIIAEVLESRDYDYVELINCSITSGLELESTASVRIRVGDDVLLSAGIGNGGFDAFINAISKVLRKQEIKLPDLTDFEVRIPRGGKTSALTEATITWSDNGGSFKTRGVHSNQVFAAMNATIRMLNRQIHDMHRAEK
ncbi:MAG: alpha-isopropylmalate synthase regulatory domain-containing protein [Candidatus Sedimenticola sp. (ex Thyasira tokunagai)]